MVGTEFIDFVQRWNIPSYVSAEDFADKFNFLFTTCVLMMCSLVIGVKQYIFKAIVCYIPTKSTGANFESYMENICWVSGTYPQKVTDQFSNKDSVWREMDGNKLHYYQWVPFILGLQCILFYMPRVIWLMIVTNRTGTDVQHLITHASDAAKEDGEKRDKTVKHIAKSMEHMLFMHRDYRSSKISSVRRRLYSVCNLMIVSKRLGTSLTFAYLAIKVLYLANAIGQMYLMQKFLRFGTNYTFFGLEIMNDIIRGRDWEVTMVFPRITACRFNMAVVGDTHTYTAQCALPVNMLNEKVYVFLWFWILMAAVVTAFSIPVWFVRMVWKLNRSGFIRRFLKLGECYNISERTYVSAFVVEFLRHDGVFILKMMQLNAGDLVTGDIVIELYKMFKNKYIGRDFRNDGHSGPNRIESPYQLKLEKPEQPSLNGTARKSGRLAKRPAPSAPILYPQPDKELSALLMDPEKPEKLV